MSESNPTPNNNLPNREKVETQKPDPRTDGIVETQQVGSPSMNPGKPERIEIKEFITSNDRLQSGSQGENLEDPDTKRDQGQSENSGLDDANPHKGNVNGTNSNPSTVSENSSGIGSGTGGSRPNIQKPKGENPKVEDVKRNRMEPQTRNQHPNLRHPTL